jgi:hypothetical protein
MRDTTVVALFDRFEAGRAAIADIINAGTPRDRISLLANDSRATHPGLIGNPAFAREQVFEESDAQPAAVTGAEVGMGVGSALGLLAGIGTLAIPGIGPLIAAGIWATVGVGAVGGGVIGGAIGAMTQHGISDKDAHLYAEGLRRGGTLVTVKATEAAYDDIARIFKAHGAVDVEKRRAAWVAEGWMSFDPDAGELAHDHVEALRLATEDHVVDHHHQVRHYFDPAGTLDRVHGGASNVTTQYGEDELAN